MQDGDHLLVGKQVLRFELFTDAERNLRPALEHGVVVFGTPVRPPWARLRQVTPAAVSRDIFHLTRPDVVLGRETGDIWSFPTMSSCRGGTLKLPSETGEGTWRTWAAPTAPSYACGGPMA